MNNLLILIISQSLGLLLPLLEIPENQKLYASIATAYTYEAMLLAGTDFSTFYKEGAIIFEGVHPPSTINSILYEKYKKS